MKWFKHISDSLDDPFIQDLMDEFGSDGYLVFFGTLEMLSREFDIDNPGIVTVSHKYFRRKLRLSWHKCSTILKFCESEGRFFVTDDGRKITVNCPKLKDMCDDWTKRLLRSNSEATPEEHHTEEEVDLEVEGEGDTTISPPGVNSVPYEKILGAYHKTLPTLHPCEMSADLQKTLKARWNSKKKMQNIEWWEWYFEGVSGCDFLLGKKTDFAATFPWLIGPRNMTKVLGGQYTNRDKTESAIEDWINE